MSADLKEIMSLSERRGPAGAVWFEGRRGDRDFVVFRRKDGSWTLYERVGASALAGAAARTGARSDAPPRQTARKPPKRMRRELVGLGLIEASDVIEEMAP